MIAIHVACKSNVYSFNIVSREYNIRFIRSIRSEYYYHNRPNKFLLGLQKDISLYKLCRDYFEQKTFLIYAKPFDNLGFCVPINENEVNFKLSGNIGRIFPMFFFRQFCCVR